jgi:hypothetical protein
MDYLDTGYLLARRPKEIRPQSGKGIINKVFTENNNNIPVDAPFVEFINRGQNVVELDRGVILQAGLGYYKAFNVSQDFSVRFYVPTTSLAVEPPIVHAGNYLVMRIHRQGGAWAEWQPATYGTGGTFSGTISQTPPTDNTGTLVTLETTGTHTIPAGARNIIIENAGATSSGGTPTTATVNGSNFSVGRIWQPNSAQNRSGNVEIELPAININGNGSMMFIAYMT